MQIKFNRAVAYVNDQVKLGNAKEASEEAVKARYIELGGLVNAADGKVREENAADDAALDTLTLAQLKKRAATQNIDIAGLTAKADIIEAIRQVEEAE